MGFNISMGKTAYITFQSAGNIKNGGKYKVAAKSCKKGEYVEKFLEGCKDEIEAMTKRFSEQDFDQFSSIFRKYESDQTLYKDDILTWLKNFREFAVAKSYKNLIIYYTGHGYNKRDSNNNI